MRNINYFSNIIDALHEKEFIEKQRKIGPADPSQLLYFHDMKEVEGGKIEFEVRMPLKVVNPLKYTSVFTEYLSRDQDVSFVRKPIVGFEYEGDRITGVITSDNEVHRYNKYVLAAGCGSTKIGKTLGQHIPILPMKGLSLNIYHKEEGMKETLIDASKQAAFVKMGDKFTRFTAFGDVEGNNLDINPVRREQIRGYAKKMFPDDYDESKENLWVGLRPVSPDDVPIIGQSRKFENLFYNIGQGSRGMKFSLGSAILL